MVQHDDVARAIYDALGQAGDRRESAGPVEDDPETILVGESSVLDSLGFVNFAVTLEQTIEERFGAQISVVDIVGEFSRERVSASDLTEQIALAVERLSGQGSGA